MKKTLLIAGGLLVAAGAAYAGGLGDAIVEMTPPAPADTAAPTSSLPSWVVPVALLALLIGAASTTSSDDETTDPYAR